MNFCGYDWILVHVDKEAEEAYFITKNIIAESQLFTKNYSASLSDDDKRMFAESNSELMKYCNSMLRVMKRQYPSIPLKPVVLTSVAAVSETQMGIFVPPDLEYIEKFDYFKTAKNRIAEYQGVAAEWWLLGLGQTGGITSDGHFISGYYVYYVTTAGEEARKLYYKGDNYCTDVKGVRPMCCVALDGLPYILKKS